MDHDIGQPVLVTVSSPRTVEAEAEAADIRTSVWLSVDDHGSFQIKYGPTTPPSPSIYSITKSTPNYNPLWRLTGVTADGGGRLVFVDDIFTERRVSITR